MAEHWASIAKVVGSIPTVAKHSFQTCPVWIYTQSNITNITYVSFNNISMTMFLEPEDVASSSEQKEGNKLTSPSKEADNEVDVESIEDTAAQNAQSMLTLDHFQTGPVRVVLLLLQSYYRRKQD